MPVVFRDQGFRFFFFSNEGSPREPAHVHVERGDGEAKLWLHPVAHFAECSDFNRREQADILHILGLRRSLVLEAWHEHFGENSPL